MIRPSALLARLRDACAGAALVEFALVLPTLMMLYLAGTEISDAISCNRKVTITARALADLVSRTKDTIAAADVDTIIGASTQIMSPYPSSQAVLRVSEIETTDYSGTVKVVWSRAMNGSVRAQGSTFKIALPTGMVIVPGLDFIYGEVTYAYQPFSSFNFTHPTSLSQTVYMVPRQSDDISCPDC